MKYLKDKRLITNDYVAKLEKWLIKHQGTYFDKNNEAKSLADFEFWQNSPIDREHLCMTSEPMLIDRNHKGVHTYCICTISKNNKVTSEIPVIEIEKLNYGDWKNGYFLLPILK
jgi:hypothetical protein